MSIILTAVTTPVYAAGETLKLDELEGMLRSSTAEAQQKLIERLSDQDASTIATLMILLHRKSQQVALTHERNKMLLEKERLEHERDMQDCDTKLKQMQAELAQSLLEKEEQIQELKKQIK